MSAAGVLSVLRRRRFSLEPAGDRLAVRPASALTPALRVAIRTYKREILELLAAEGELCVFCALPVATGDLLCCPEHRARLGYPAADGWRCICTSTYRRPRPEWSDWVCAGCGMTTGAPQ